MIADKRFALVIMKFGAIGEPVNRKQGPLAADANPAIPTVNASKTMTTAVSVKIAIAVANA